MKMLAYMVAGILIVPFILAAVFVIVAWPLHFFDPNGWYAAYIIGLIGATVGASAYVEEHK